MTLIGASREATDKGLLDSGVALTREALTIALGDPRPDVRSLAALKLGEIGKQADMAPLMQALIEEKDDCTEFAMRDGLQSLVPGLAYDARQHPGGQPWITPFQPCKASEPALVTLTVEQVTALPPAALRFGFQRGTRHCKPSPL